MLNVSMLGRLSVTVAQHRIALDLGPSGRMMAGYLFEFPGRVHRRDYLAEMFWGERTPAQARAAMNTALWRLRKLLDREPHAPGETGLCSHADEIVFECPSWVDIDTHGFDAAVRQALAEPSLQDAAHRAQVLEAATLRYVGCFLEGDDGDWVIAERERLHSLYVRCLGELVRLYAAGNDLEPAIAAARRVLAADPFRETVVRILALLLFLNGQRAQAITELTRWQVALRAQVGVDALPETLALRCALVSGTICDEIERWRQSHLGHAASGRPDATAS